MMNPLSPEEILISIHPDYKRCGYCFKCFHREKNAVIHKTLFSYYLETRCIICQGDHSTILRRLQHHKICFSQLESVYGDIYEITFNKHANRFIFKIKST